MQKLIAGAGALTLELSQYQLEQFETYYQELIDWNRRINLTAIIDYEEVQVKHFLDSLTIVLALETLPSEGLSVIDVGTGAGLPGLPLKIAFPGIRLALLEATGKKAAFLEHVSRRLGLDGVEIISGRAETAAHQPLHRQQFDMALSRGVAELGTLAELTLPFCKTGGCLVAQKKGDIDQELDEAAGAINTLGGRLRKIVNVELEGLDDRRCLVVIDKVSPTPNKYPRRPGLPAKRPLAGTRIDTDRAGN